MTESVFLAIASAFLYYVRQHKWSMVAILGFLACLTKVQGLLLAFAVLVELFYSEGGVTLLRGKKWRDFLHKVLLCLYRRYHLWFPQENASHVPRLPDCLFPADLLLELADQCRTLYPVCPATISA